MTTTTDCVRLSHTSEKRLKRMLSDGTPARIAKRARILLALHGGASISEAAELAWAGTATVKRIKKRFRLEGLTAALYEKERSGAPHKTSAEERAELIALACSSPPEGHPRWTYELLWERWAPKESVSPATVRLILKADGVKPWREKNVVCTET